MPVIKFKENLWERTVGREQAGSGRGRLLGTEWRCPGPVGIWLGPCQCGLVTDGLLGRARQPHQTQHIPQPRV